jgi:hypothetical protein
MEVVNISLVYWINVLVILDGKELNVKLSAPLAMELIMLTLLFVILVELVVLKIHAHVILDILEMIVNILFATLSPPMMPLFVLLMEHVLLLILVHVVQVILDHSAI